MCTDFSGKIICGFYHKVQLTQSKRGGVNQSDSLLDLLIVHVVTDSLFRVARDRFPPAPLPLCLELVLHVHHHHHQGGGTKNLNNPHEDRGWILQYTLQQIERLASYLLTIQMIPPPTASPILLEFSQSTSWDLRPPPNRAIPQQTPIQTPLVLLSLRRK